MRMPRRPGTPSTVTGRVLAILGAFVLDDDPSGLTLNEISRRTGLPLSTTFRLVGELLEGRMLQRDDDLRYSIGPRVNELGHARGEVASPSLRG